ncbi:hypothetical protein Q428_00150 [Fervidicella metallireducens AeB]|uniref:DUF3899 domain-containing protein n=1 Tax=Fervidicella metallireducens AeB TaxID=1403537 RepID=A0A017RZ41_9CLOT|nr:hypothetical protein [Fervidicella metallireducens]EYE89856.1 hypothetical protein Q428_00150 [Fervidicella metallireducens AeB]
MDKRLKRKHLVKGIKFSFYSSLGALILISIIALVYSLIKSTPIVRNIYISLYYFGGFALMTAVPFLYKRNEDSKIRKIRRLSPLYGFYDMFENPYTDKAMMESFEEFKGDGFTMGMLIILFCVLVMLYGFIIENIYFILLK